MHVLQILYNKAVCIKIKKRTSWIGPAIYRDLGGSVKRVTGFRVQLDSTQKFPEGGG